MQALFSLLARPFFFMKELLCVYNMGMPLSLDEEGVSSYKSDIDSCCRVIIFRSSRIGQLGKKLELGTAVFTERKARVVSVPWSYLIASFFFIIFFFILKLLSIYIFLDSNTFAVKAYAEFVPFFGQRMGFVRKSQLKIRILWTP